MKEAELAALRLDNGRVQTNELMRNISVLLSKLATLERDPSSREYDESYATLKASINRMEICIAEIPKNVGIKTIYHESRPLNGTLQYLLPRG